MELNIDTLKPSLNKRQKRRDKRLNKELTECYRTKYGAWEVKGYKKRVRKNEFEQAKNKEGIKEMHKGGTKYFNDNLEPLVRYLEAHVGQHWDKVYSKLCKQLDKKSVSGLHVFQHLKHFVCEKVWIEDKKVYDADLSYVSRKLLVSTERCPRFYVSPKTGQLIKARLVRRKEYSEIVLNG